METISFFVSGVPKAQPRVKAARRGKFVHIYTPDTAEEWKSKVRKLSAERISTKIKTPVYVDMAFHIERPKFHFRKNGTLKSTEYWVSKKPDVDNFAKAVMDAMTDAGVWEDDSLVVMLSVSKRYANERQEGCLIQVGPVAN